MEAQIEADRIERDIVIRPRIEAEIAAESAIRRSRLEAEIEAAHWRRVYPPY